MAFKFGYRPSLDDRRDVQASAVFGTLALPKPPEKTTWGDKLPAQLGMYANDKYGCCTVACIAHLLELWTAQHGPMERMADDNVLAAYNKINGGVDQGAQPRDALNLMRGTKNNSSIGGHRIARYARLDNSIEEIEQATWAFGGCYLAVFLPRNYQDFDSWADTNPRFKPDPNAGHALNVIDYDHSLQQFVLATWGRKVIASYAWVEKYIANGESWLLLSPDWWGKQALAPSGLSLSEAVKTFQEISRGK